MPMITSTGQSRHRFQVGSGFYTMSDEQRGTTPTPSQAERGISTLSLESRWYRLPSATKRAWQLVSSPPWRGRTLYTTLNRERWNVGLATTDHPPGGGLQPVGVVISNVRATIDGILPGFPTYIFDSGPGAADQWVELSIYKPAVIDPLGENSAARWLIAGMFPFSAAPDTDNLIPMGGFPRGPSGAFHEAPTPPAGTAIRLRFIVCSDGLYPGAPQFFTTTVQP